MFFGLLTRLRCEFGIETEQTFVGLHSPVQKLCVSSHGTLLRFFRECSNTLHFRVLVGSGSIVEIISENGMWCSQVPPENELTDTVYSSGSEVFPIGNCGLMWYQ